MAIFKKKDLLKHKIDELVDADGAPIEGDDTFNSTSQVNVGGGKQGSGAEPVTTDKFVKTARQGVRPWGSWGYYGGSGNVAVNRDNIMDAGVNDKKGPQDDDDDANMQITKDVHNQMPESYNIEEIAKHKMTKMLEDIITNKMQSNNDFVSKNNRSDVTRKNIAGIEELDSTYSNPVAKNAALKFVNDIKSVSLSGDEMAIILNYILGNMDLKGLSNDYKNILARYIR